MSSTKRAGKTHWIIVFAVLAIVGGFIVLLIPNKSAAKTANDFLVALAKDDREKLTDLTYWPDKSREQIRASWDKTMEAAKHYRFAWKMVSEKDATEENTGVVVMVFRNAMSSGTFEEKFEIPLQKQNGEWKVDVRGINREMFPALPR